jgi:YbbR domain-containing protein
MKIIKNSKLLLKILSGLIAVVLWFAITYTEDPAITQTLTGVNLEIKGEETLNANGFAIVNKDDLPSISVVIRGSRSNVISALGEIYASIDVSSVKKAGTSVLSVSYSYPTGRVVLERAKLKEISIETEALISREIPVKTEIVNRDKNSGVIIKSVPKNETVTISGAQSDVYKISYARVRVDASKISKTSTQECLYGLYTDKDVLVSEENIVSKSRNTVTVESTVYEKTELSVRVVLSEEIRKDYGFLVKNTEKATVEAGLDEGVDVKYIEAVVTPQKGKNSYDAELIVPEGVYVAEEDMTFSVTGEVLPKELREISVSVEAVNVPDGKTVIVVPKEEKITLKTAESLSAINAKATVDVGKMTEAEEILPVAVETDNDAEIIGTYSVQVKLETGE